MCLSLKKQYIIYFSLDYQQKSQPYLTSLGSINMREHHMALLSQ